MAAAREEDNAVNTVTGFGDIQSEIGLIKNSLHALEATDRSSLSALQSRTYQDRAEALASIESSLEQVQNLQKSAQRLTDELNQRRARIGSIVYPVHNSTLPVMRLLPDIFPLIVSDVAEVWRPSDSTRDLGWIKLSHVCSAWRQTVLSLALLWAREVGTFQSPESFSTIVRRAQGVPLSLGKSRSNPSTGQPLNILDDPLLHDLYFEILPQARSLRLTIKREEDIARLAQELSHIVMPHLEMVAIVNTFPLDITESTFSGIFSVTNCPNLRALSLGWVFLPFSRPGLTHLDLRNHKPRIPGDQFLDMLSETADTLESLYLVFWMPVVWEVDPARLVSLTRLRVMILLFPPERVKYTTLCQHLYTPSLASLSVEPSSGPHLLSDVHSVLDRVISSDQLRANMPHHPRLALRFGKPGSFTIDQLTVHMDSDDVDDYFTSDPRSMRSYFPGLEDPLNRPIRSGVELIFTNIRNTDLMRLPMQTIFQSIVARCASSRLRSGLSPIKSINFDSMILFTMDLREMSSHLMDVEIVYIDLPAAQADDIRVLPTGLRHSGILVALASLQPDGSFPLPRLQTIVCKPWPPADRDDGRVSPWIQILHEQLNSLTEARALHGSPIALRPWF
ncbi:hypothetical protein PENSPDRAFT_690173 [Peniophora sp. CONT]|nr:hypothetical protein PENSPDRAFT_690173 [Peniophora sp. CONT]